MINKLFNRIDQYHMRLRKAYERGIRERYGDDYVDERDNEWDEEEEEPIIPDNDVKPISEEETDSDKYPVYYYRSHILPDYRGYYLPASPDTDLDEIRFDQSWDCILGHGDYKHVEHRVKPCRYTVSPDNPWYFEIDGVVFSKETGLLILFPPGKSETYTIPDDERITGIGDGAFAGNNLLKEIILNDRISYIGYSAFACCKKLQEIEIPQSVEYINQEAFADCTTLKIITMNCRIKMIPYRCFQDDTSLETVRLPEGIEFIDRGAFSRCSALKDLRVRTEDRNDYDIILPPSLREVKGETFFGCTSIRSVFIQGITSTIGDRAFAGCTALQIVNSEPVETYRAFCFENCTSLENFTFSSNTQKLGIGLFFGANNLKKITFSCASDLTCAIDTFPDDMEYDVDTTAYLAISQPYKCKPIFLTCIRNLAYGEKVPENVEENAVKIMRRNRKRNYDWFLSDLTILGWILAKKIPGCDDALELQKIAKANYPQATEKIETYIQQHFTARKIATACETLEQRKRAAREKELEKQVQKEKEEREQKLKEEMIEEGKKLRQEAYLHGVPEEKNISVEEMGLSPEICDCLKRKGVYSLKELAAMTNEDIIRHPRIRYKGFNEILGKLMYFLSNGQFSPEKQESFYQMFRDDGIESEIFGLDNSEVFDVEDLENFSVDDLSKINLDDDI